MVLPTIATARVRGVARTTKAWRAVSPRSHAAAWSVIGTSSASPWSGEGASPVHDSGRITLVMSSAPMILPVFRSSLTP